MFIKRKTIDWSGVGRHLVIIDAANLENSVKSLGWWVDYGKLFRLFNSQTQLVQIRYYCPHFYDERQNKFFTVLKKNGFKLITKPLKVITEIDKAKGDIRKANFDVEIALDAVALLDAYDTLILFSGDSDFNYLIKQLRQKDKKVIVISSRYHISKELIESSNRYIDLRVIRNEIERKK
jgi:uncharacterized LabA/DUF88 family protein